MNFYYIRYTQSSNKVMKQGCVYMQLKNTNLPHKPTTELGWATSPFQSPVEQQHQ